MKISAFILITLLLTFVIVFYSSLTHVTWDGHCSYKEEHGMIPFYRSQAGEGPADECKNGVMYPGIFYLGGMVIFYIFLICLTWKFDQVTS